ncbi:MAG: hypothetical protein MJ123_07620 [Lachnospiraceae bacterium]|nr:hypothetical protein [Lachnospiraceae bacterium]
MKKFTFVVALAIVLLGNIAIHAEAVNKGSYGYMYITKTGDYLSASLTKINPYDAASNLVDSVDGGTLVSWIENTSGTNITSKVSYSEPAPVYMLYNKSTLGATRLKISTKLTNMKKTGTFGGWSPDYTTTY